MIALDWNPTPRKLRQFAGVALVVLGGLAAGSVHRSGTAGPGAWILLALALLIGVPGLLRPSCVRLAYVIASAVAFPIGWVLSRVLLAFVFYAVLTPTALVLRLLGRDPLQLRSGARSPSHWTPRAAPSAARRYLRQS